MMNKTIHEGLVVLLSATVLLLPFAHIKVTLFSLPLYLPEITTLLALSLFLGRVVAEKDLSWPGGQRPDAWVVWGGVLFLLGAITSFVFNPVSLTGLGMIKSWFVFPIIFGVLLWYEVGQTEKRTVLFVWLVSLMGIALRSIWLFLAGETTYDHRLAGDYTSPNFLAYTLAPAVPLLFFFLFSGKKAWWKSTVLTLGLGLALTVLFLTHSYGAWSGLAAALIVFFWGGFGSAFPFRMRLAALLTVLCVFGFFFLDQGGEKWQSLISGDPRSSLASRMMIWRSATAIMADSPIIGVGVGRFQAAYLEYQSFFPPYLEWAVPEPHNLLLAVFSATGLLGLFGFGLLLGRLLVLLCREQGSHGETGGPFSLFFLSIMVLFLVYGMTDTPYFTTGLAFTFFLWFALALPKGEGEERRGEV